jgi:hypothetical protein
LKGRGVVKHLVHYDVRAAHEGGVVDETTEEDTDGAKHDARVCATLLLQSDLQSSGE